MMDAITEHHYVNIANGKAVKNDDGSLSTVKTRIVEIDGVETLIPTVWDGEIVDDATAINFSINSGVEWPTRTGDSAVEELEAFDAEIHKQFTDKTSPEEAAALLDAAYNQDTESTESGLMAETSPRPKSRPKTEIPYADADKIERLVWAEARGEGVEGRNAVRGVIFNRLASSRFPDTVDELLTADEFEPIREYGDVYSIPVPEEDLQEGHAEFADYYQIGEDAVDGRTFFQNTGTTKSRGTDFSGPDPITVGKHTFTRGYEDQEPVYDTNFSHNITVTYPEYAAADIDGMALGGLAVARKGITTQEGVDMANNKFQLDRKKADKDGDGKLSQYEEAAGEAVQRAIDKDELVEMYHGGMAFDGIMADPVSGNEIPIGSSAENVRDDIEAMISEGEYVLPANVVKWHGLKHIMNMQSEAEMGLMGMQATGLIQYAGEEAEEEPEEVSDAEEDDVLETDIEIEVAAVEVDDKLDDDEEVEEIFPRMSVLPGVMKDKKYAFIS